MTIEQDVENLLIPTDAVTNWYRAVAALDAAAATPVLIRVLADEAESLSRRRLAAIMLGVLRDNRAVPALIGATRVQDRVLRGHAAEALGNFPRLAADVVPRLVAGLSDPDAYLRECSAKALGQLKWTGALPVLEQMRNHDALSSNREAAQEAIDAIRGGR